MYSKAKSKEVVPEMRSASGRACTFFGVEAFVGKLGHDVSLSGESVVGRERGECTRA